MGLFSDLLAQFGLGRTDFQRDQQRIADRVGQAQAGRVEQGTRLRADLEALIREMAGGGAPPVFRLGTRPGQGTDIEEFIGQINPRTAELNQLFRLLGVGEGNVSTANQALGQAGDFERRRQDNLSTLIGALLGGF